MRPVDQPYFQELRGKRLGTTDFAAFQAKAREKGVAAFRAVLEPARRVLSEQKFLAGEQPAYPDYALAGAFLWARIATPAGTAGAGRSGPCLARAHARPVRWHGPQGEGGVKYDAVVFDLLTALLEFLDLVERRRGLARRRHEVAPALPRDHLRLRRLQTL